VNVSPRKKAGARRFHTTMSTSRMSHEELDAAEQLDAGDPADLAGRYVGLGGHLPRLTILGGCCGTDRRHVAAIASAWRDATHRR
jgi:S-methylmethionine-dependent homocysteine/selenocysteine methylase